MSITPDIIESPANRRDQRLRRIALASARFGAWIQAMRDPRPSRQLFAAGFLPRAGARRVLMAVRKREELLMSAAGRGNRAYRRQAVTQFRLA